MLGLLCRAGGNIGDSLLHEWQADVLRMDRVLQGRNVVYCAPTSGGKSLVAEILALRRICSTNKAAMLVLPFVSLCEEKARHWERLLDSLHLKVRAPAWRRHTPHRSMHSTPCRGLLNRR